MSLRTRLLAGMALVAAVLVVVSVFITLATRERLIAQIDQRLASISPDQDGDRDGNVPGTQPPPRDEENQERFSDVYQGFVDVDGTLVTRFVPNIGGQYAAPAIEADQLPRAGRRVFTTGSQNGDHTYRVLATSFGGVTAITAVPLDDVQSTVSQLIVVEVIGAVVILAALGLVTWWVIHLGIRPVKEMTQTATRIAEGDLDVRIPESAAGTESGDLAVALNRMLGTIDDALDERAASEARLRRFVADASHELRTPVTTIRGYAELYRHGGLGDAGALDDAMRRTEQEAARMGRLVDDMLVLAKLDEERPLDTEDVDVGALVRDAADDAGVASPGRSSGVEVDEAADLRVRGDEDRLRQVLANVVGNAVVHTTTDVPVTLRARRVGDLVTVEVEDRGHGMPADVAERITERFYRADPARSRHRGGSGLGLSIAEAAVRAHGGSVTVESAPDVGTTVTLTLPARGGGDGQEVPATPAAGDAAEAPAMVDVGEAPATAEP